MNLRSFAAVVALSLTGCSPDSSPDRSAQDSDTGSTPGFAHETVVSGLAVPWAIEFAADGRVFVTERPGRIRVLRDWQLDPQPWATLDIVAAGEAGLMGLAISPDFANDRHIFVVGTFLDRGRIINRVIRLTERDGRGADPVTIVDHIPAAEFHAGDAIEFGPDGMLYVATGDAGDPGDAQDIQSLAGKILRYRPDGTVPADNPWPGSPVYARGLRNVQGITWHPVSGHLLATDHGPSGFPNERFRRNNDELNVIRRAGNYGWPDVAGKDEKPGLIAPIAVWSPGIAPSGLAIYDGPVLGWKGDVFVAGLRGQQLRRIVLEQTGDSTAYRVTREQRLFHDIGRIRAVTMGPDGNLYFATSNWDGRGDPAAGDDRIFRLVPR